MTNRWVSSRYSRVVRWDGTGGMIYNSFSGAMAAFEPDEEPEVRRIMERGALHEGMCGMASDLRDAGFLVPDGTDELAQAHKLHTALMEATSMHLVIMPTEACNFRCTYCYQSFPRGAMARGTIDGLKAYVRHAAAGLDHLAVSWFGGASRCLFPIQSPNCPILSWKAVRKTASAIPRTCPPTDTF